jgi:DNA-binding HxlR family transcriptional regulator
LSIASYSLIVVEMKAGVRSHCPISLSLEVLGDKWSLLVLRDLLLRGKRRYQEFLAADEGISTNILAERLVRLEKRDVITKAKDPADGRQFLYTPTQKGLDLLPVILELAQWGIKHDPNTDLTRPITKRLAARGSRTLEKEIRSRFATVGVA